MARLEWAINLALHADRAIPSDRSILGTCDPALTLDPLNSKPPDTDQTLPHVVLPLNGNQLIAIEPVYNLAVK